MKYLVVVFLSLLLYCQIAYTKGFEETNSVELTISYEFGKELTPTGYTNIYVIWLESVASFIQNLKVCQSLVKGGLTNTALPFWNMNKRSKSSVSEINAVTSATQKNCNFSITATLQDTLKKFTVFVETDRSFESNDWFKDQPAVLYSADINLNDTTSVYTLNPVGWTPNEGTENVIPNTPKGVLQKEMRYITNKKSESSFGDTDSRSLTSMVKSIKVSIKNRSYKKLPVRKINNQSGGLSIYDQNHLVLKNFTKRPATLLSGRVSNHLNSSTYQFCVGKEKLLTHK
jgi:hypothetical protein